MRFLECGICFAIVLLLMITHKFMPKLTILFTLRLAKISELIFVSITKLKILESY